MKIMERVVFIACDNPLRLFTLYENGCYHSFSEPNVCFIWLQTTEQRAIMSSAGLIQAINQ